MFLLWHELGGDLMEFEFRPRVDITNKEGLTAEILNLLSKSIKEVQQGVAPEGGAPEGVPPEILEKLIPNTAIDNLEVFFRADGGIGLRITQGDGKVREVSQQTTKCISDVENPEMGEFLFTKEGHQIKLDFKHLMELKEVL